MVADDTVDGRVADVDRAQDLPQQRWFIAVTELDRQEGAALVLENDLEVMHLVGGDRLRSRHEGDEAVLGFPWSQLLGEQRVVGKAVADVRARQPHPRRVDAGVEMAGALQQHHGHQLSRIEKPSRDEDARTGGVQHDIVGEAHRCRQRRDRLMAGETRPAHPLQGANDADRALEAAQHVLEMRHHLQVHQSEPRFDDVEVEVRSLRLEIDARQGLEIDVAGSLEEGDHPAGSGQQVAALEARG